jgi:hypothetical protein
MEIFENLKNIELSNKAKLSEAAEDIFQTNLHQPLLTKPVILHSQSEHVLPESHQNGLYNHDLPPEESLSSDLQSEKQNGLQPEEQPIGDLQLIPDLGLEEQGNLQSPKEVTSSLDEQLESSNDSEDHQEATEAVTRFAEDLASQIVKEEEAKKQDKKEEGDKEEEVMLSTHEHLFITSLVSHIVPMLLQDKDIVQSTNQDAEIDKEEEEEAALCGKIQYALHHFAWAQTCCRAGAASLLCSRIHIRKA